MTIYSGPVFEMARQQFQVIADHLEIPHDERDRLLYPKRGVVGVLSRSTSTTARLRCSRVTASSTI